MHGAELTEATYEVIVWTFDLRHISKLAWTEGDKEGDSLWSDHLKVPVQTKQSALRLEEHLAPDRNMR